MSTVSQASSAFRTTLRPGHRNRFLTVCCEIVLAPRRALAAPGVAERHPDRLDVEAVVVQELLVFRRDHSERRVRGNLIPIGPPVDLPCRVGDVRPRRCSPQHEGGRRGR